MRFGLIALLAVLSAGAARAQTCGAAPSLRTVGYRAGAGVGFGRNVRVFSMGGAAGLRDSPLYASASIGLMELKDLDRSALTTALNVGLEAPLDALRKSGLCPFVGAGTQTGPKNILNTGVNYSDVDVGAGLAVGREVRRWEGGMVAIAAEGLYQHVFYRYQSRTGWLTGNTDHTVVTFTLGVATGRVLFRATLSQPVDTADATPSFGFLISLLGSPRSKR